ncbi:MAG: Asp23/Gls24 family envelope stress response protein [Oscillospiraceae bacterium]|nr:Asp23/Gls24 family envelope stress response protein [Oscillospiraceae bacterium]
MAETKEYLVQTQESGSILISEEVIASIAALAVREVEGVYGLSASTNFDISNLLGKKNLRKGIRVALNGDEISIACNLVLKMGSAVMTVAKNVQEAISDEVASMTGIRPVRVNVNVCGVVTPKSAANK